MYRKHWMTECHPFFGHRHHWKRRFLTEEEKKELKERSKEKKIKWIEQYKESLKHELKGVTEALEKLKKE
jgi:hypothetical protein